MVGKITKNFRLHNAKQFMEQFDEESPSNVYFFIGKSTGWVNDAEPPEPFDTTSETSFDIWQDILALKRVSPSDVSFGINRVDWVKDTIYEEYTSNSEFHNGSFYVMNEEYNVYKCLDNNNRSPSTVKPSGILLTPITTNDGYVWKYMFTVSASDALKFTTNKYIPVRNIVVNDDSRQWQVQQSAANGSIDTVQVNAPGIGYQETLGNVTVGGTSAIRLASNASNIFDIYNGSFMYILSGTGVNQYARVVDYDGSNKLATVSPPFSIPLDASSTYIISPHVKIEGDGRNAVAYSRVTSGGINSVNMINGGVNYSYADLSFTANTGNGGNATGYIAPIGGHGRYPVEELFAHNIIMNIKLRGNEANTFMSTNDFRTVGLVVDPVDNTSGVTAGGTSYDQTTILNLTDEFLTFTSDETITSSGGTKAFVVEYADGNSIRVAGNRKDFTVGQTISGNVSGATAEIQSIKKPGIRKYSGSILYIENRSPTTRSSDQEEDIKIVVKF